MQPESTKDVVRVAAVGDLHCSKGPQVQLQPLFAQASEKADVLLLCGDLTDYGLPDEARALASELKASAKIPVVAVLGNHDYESGRQEEIKEILQDAGVRVLDGDGCEIHGVGFAGTKGFVGGFGQRALQAWGEPLIKRLVHEGVEEALKLESALARLRAENRVVLLHYAPLRQTVEGEAAELLPFLGSSRLEEPINRYRVTAVFHGHCHHGSPEGRTATGIPVYNVALPLLQERFPEKPPFRLFELHARKVAHETRVSR